MATTHPALDTLLELSLSTLDHVDILKSAAVSRFWLVICLNEGLWKLLCQRMWCDKVYIPQKIKDLSRSDARQAFRDALIDSKRNWITLDELLEFRWWHRMKASAGEHFTASDSWWNRDSQSQRLFRFRRDGTLYWIDPATEQEEQGTVGTWRFVPRCCGHTDGFWGIGAYDSGKDRPQFGTFLRGRPRQNIRETPTKIVRRHAATWGFILDSCWAVQTSWPMPTRGQDPSLEDDALIANVDNMQVEAFRFNTGQQIDAHDPDPGSEDDDWHGHRLLHHSLPGSARARNGQSFVRVRIGDEVHILPLAMVELMQQVDDQ